MITNPECWWLDARDESEGPFELGGDGPFWFTGDELTNLVAEKEIQFIWGVLSGFPHSVTLDLEQLDITPTIWEDRDLADFPEFGGRIQHPLAEIEIVCVDSSFMRLCSRDRSISERFRRYFPEAR